MFGAHTLPIRSFKKHDMAVFQTRHLALREYISGAVAYSV